MSEIFQCGDQGALVGYLYDECTPEERDAIASHLTRCVSCADDVSGLSSTRRALAAWAPPQVDLGLQITRKADVESALAAGDALRADAALRADNVLSFTRPPHASSERTPWWKAPLPAWAQVAAAAVIFAAGLSVGYQRDRAPVAEAPQKAVTTVAPVAGPSNEDLVQLERRLRTEIAQLAHSSTPVAAPVPVAARSGDDLTMAQVKALIAESEHKQNVDFTERAVRQRAEFEIQRRADLESMGSRIGTLQGQTGAQLGQLRQGFEILATRVSQQK
jgi:Putative zinc-finger